MGYFNCFLDWIITKLEITDEMWMNSFSRPDHMNYITYLQKYLNTEILDELDVEIPDEPDETYIPAA